MVVSTLENSSVAVAQLDELLRLIGLTLEITATQRAAAEQHYLSIARWLGGEDGAPFRLYEPQIYPQGSLRLGTTVKPILDGEYDLDIVYELQIDYTLIPRPVMLLDMIERRLREHGTYRNMVERKNRCVRVNYQGQFHLDILPAALDRVCGGTCVRVPDCSTEWWKPSNPRGYADYFERRALTTASFAEGGIKASVEQLPAHLPHEAKTTLQKEVQLIKRLRDVTFAGNCELAPISIVLTTLAANNYWGERSVSHAIGRTLDSICAQIPPTGRLYVFNPSNPEEDLSERWDKQPETYVAFCEAVRGWRRAWAALLDVRGGIDRVVAELERLFGATPVRRAIEEQIKELEAARRAGTMGVNRASGLITTSAGASHAAVRSNTFYGS